LETPVAEWAQIVLNSSKRKDLRKAEALAHVSQSKFSVQRSTEALCQAYVRAVQVELNSTVYEISKRGFYD
jgi:hypothetical protein